MVPPATVPAANTSGAPPALKPIAKGPFPDGATEEQVCEAILDVQQTDLWVRFGHLIPAYERGVVFVLDAGPDRVKDVYDYVLRRYNGGGAWGPLIKACATPDKSILYIRRFGPDGELDGMKTGPAHLSAELLAHVGIKTEASFQFLASDEVLRQGGVDRLEQYCRSDARLCESLMTLLAGPNAKGLCPWALTLTSVAEDSTEYELLRGKCLQRSGPPFSCAMYRKTPAEQEQCRQYVHQELGMP